MKLLALPLAFALFGLSLACLVVGLMYEHNLLAGAAFAVACLTFGATAGMALQAPQNAPQPRPSETTLTDLAADLRALRAVLAGEGHDTLILTRGELETLMHGGSVTADMGFGALVVSVGAGSTKLTASEVEARDRHLKAVAELDRGA